MKKFKIILLAILVVGFNVQAQVCGSGYERAERSKMLSLHPKVERYLVGMALIAEVTANTADLTLSEIHDANLRYQRIKSELDLFSQRYRRNLSQRGNLFVSEVLNSEYLQIQNTLVDGSTNLESQENSREALDRLNFAITAALVCFKNSWDRHTIVGSENDGNCAGGFDSRDRHVVRGKARELVRILTDMAYLAEFGANNTLFWLQQITYDADYQYLKEEVDIFGEKRVRNVSNRTITFINTLFDPIFLGLQTTTLNGGGNSSVSQENSRHALDSLNVAISEVNRCTR